MYKNKSDEDCFAHDDMYASSKDLAKKTVSDKIGLMKLHQILNMMDI